MEPSKQCLTWGADNPPSARLCHCCGRPLPERPAEPGPSGAKRRPGGRAGIASGRGSAAARGSGDVHQRLGGLDNMRAHRTRFAISCVAVAALTLTTVFAAACGDDDAGRYLVVLLSGLSGLFGRRSRPWHRCRNDRSGGISTRVAGLPRWKAGG